jgi:hypothetical protein
VAREGYLLLQDSFKSAVQEAVCINPTFYADGVFATDAQTWKK